MTSQEYWSNDGADFIPTDQTNILVHEIEECLKSRNPSRYIEKKYPPEGKLTIGQRFATHALEGMAILSAIYIVNDLAEGMSKFVHFAP